ncbi:hypothetical protein GCM10025868_23050 [Angustibacter aerolatus]|uniref:DNA replication and repair protein RecF n=1 Tax=Angustibacter aerolatus TaxID=1162965 RepID=A0ABQ6JJR7_9ACTN|nr:DNA replication/repair protein RecF [Angustibacter aerolatus]GMA87055.1 hypothetical protein GCM10025868_23050 [Angustibacter aerolatus]
MHGTFKAWTRGTVVRSWLLDLLVKALEVDQDLADITGYVEDSGEGRWTLEEGIANSVPMPALAASLFARFESRQEDSPAMKAVAALRNQFGGHAVRATEAEDAVTAGPSSGTGATRRRSAAVARRPPVAGGLPQYPTVELSLDPGVTALVGPNGQGKTNLVEAIGYVATLGSHRVSNDAPLVRFGAERAVVRAQVVRDGRPTLVEIEVTPGRANRARVNRGPVPRAREVLGLLRTVLFAPEDLALVKGDPGERRRFLDDLLVARAPRFAGVRSDYERVLKQRSALLKSAGSAIRRGQGDVRTLDVWDQHLATAGAELLAARLRLVRDLRPHVATAYEAVSQGQGAAEIGYRSSLADDLLAEVADAAGGGREPAAGPAAGGHLADALGRGSSAGSASWARTATTCCCRLGPFPAKGYASHGESWSYALALRLASYEPAAARGRWRPGARARRRVRRGSTSAAASGWPNWSPARSRCSSRPPCRRTSRRRWRERAST